jgi:2-iminobutanoate/2-iminopropanoate deaminase
MEFVNDRNGTPPHGPYSHAVKSGNMLYISGQVPFDNKDELIGADIACQTEQTMKNLASLLDSAGLSLSNVVKTTVYLVDWGDFAGFNTVYGRFMGGHKPARATVKVGGLVPGCLVELEAVAEFSA